MGTAENLLRLGCTLCPASLTVIPSTRTWSITVLSQISSEITVLGLALVLPHPPLPPRTTPLTRTLLQLRLFPSSFSKRVMKSLLRAQSIFVQRMFTVLDIQRKLQVNIVLQQH